jgi:hypothetical protein
MRRANRFTPVSPSPFWPLTLNCAPAPAPLLAFAKRFLIPSRRSLTSPPSCMALVHGSASSGSLDPKSATASVIHRLTLRECSLFDGCFPGAVARWLGESSTPRRPAPRARPAVITPAHGPLFRRLLPSGGPCRRMKPSPDHRQHASGRGVLQKYPPETAPVAVMARPMSPPLAEVQPEQFRTPVLAP